MARRARYRALARALQVDVVLVCNVEDVVPLVRFDSLEQVAFGVLEVDFDSAGAIKEDEKAMR